jgi:alkylation response protein AidB-like acyl-CoA dehydrogenase
MDFSFTEEQQLVQETARSFAARELKPVASRMDREGAFPEEFVKQLGSMGLLGVFVPQEYGGAGMDMISYVIALEEISKVWASLGTIMSVNNSLVCGALMRFGSEAQKKKYLERLATGEWLGCYSLTEAHSGSDAAAMQSQARREGSDYVLNGSKVFTTNGSRADLALMYALTEPAQNKQGISAFLVETKTPGFTVSRLEDKLGLRSSDTAALTLEDCRVPQENRLGSEGEGFKIALGTLDGGRIGIAAQAVGIGQGCLDEAMSYVCERRQFGKPLSEFGAIQAMLADMATEIDAARALTYRAAWLFAQGKNVTRAAAMAKLYASEACNRSAYKALQIFGGYGYTKEFPVERFFRDARVTTLYEGTSEIQRLIIARSLIAEGEPFRGSQEKSI